MSSALLRSRLTRPLHFTRSISTDIKSKRWEAIVVGGGHNGLIAAAYLAKAGKQVLVLERRNVVGGAAVTEELYPGFKYSRASYLMSLLRSDIITDLDLKKYGFTLLRRNPSSFTPSLGAKDPYLLLGPDGTFNHSEIAKFSKKDAENFPKFEAYLEKIVDFFDPMLDEVPLDNANFDKVTSQAGAMSKMAARAVKLGLDPAQVWELMTAPASKILDRWFESDMLKATLATDGIIGAMVSPSSPGSGYVLFHHVMGNLEGHKNSWAYVKGGMGAFTQCVAAACRDLGVTIQTEAPVKRVAIENGRAVGVELEDGSVIAGRQILSNCTPKVTFEHLVDPSHLPSDFNRDVKQIDYTAAQTKINCAVDRLPNFKCVPNNPEGTPGPQHTGTIHMGSDSMSLIENCFKEAFAGLPSSRPIIEMTIPSSLDDSISPPGKHVVQLFVQYTPYKPKDGDWNDPAYKQAFASRVFKTIDEYAPGFSSSVLHADVLTPPDLERIFNLTGGNIFHGSMNLHSLYFNRPVPGFSGYKTPIKNLYLCGSGAHPGGGVMGAPGRNCAKVVVEQDKIYEMKDRSLKGLAKSASGAVNSAYGAVKSVASSTVTRVEKAAAWVKEKKDDIIMIIIAAL